MKKILYNYWGHLSDKIGISSPDGNFSYLWSVFREFQNRDIDVYNVVDRDKESIEKYNKEAFASFSQEKRWDMYNKIKFIGLESALKSDFPNDIDLLIMEWRMKTKDNQSGASPDLQIQNNILNFYKDKNKPLRIIDLDYTISNDDEKSILDLGYKNVKILEQGLFPQKQIIDRETFYIPFDFEDMLQFETPLPNRKNLLSYVGNFYNREEDINTKISPFAKNNPGRVHFFGNWMKDELAEFRSKNKGIIFHDRIGAQEFREAIGPACAVPLLSPNNYKTNGVMTMRILESLLFGSIPIGFSDFKGIENWLPKELIVKMDKDGYIDSMNEVVDNLSRMTWTKRNVLRRDLVKNLENKHTNWKFVNQLIK